VGRASNLPEDVRNVYVHPLENDTARSQVEQILTRAIVDEMVTRRRFALTNTAAEADAEIRGTVLRFVTQPVSFDGQGRATEYELSITAKMVFQRVAASEDEEPQILWRNDRYLFRQAYDVDVNEAAYFDREDETIEELAERFAETMVSDLLEGF
jgi:outer membrane lipopolysaccharide assembly protein LptE/RlpB